MDEREKWRRGVREHKEARTPPPSLPTFAAGAGMSADSGLQTFGSMDRLVLDRASATPTTYSYDDLW